MQSRTMCTTLLINSSFYPSTGGVETTLKGMAEALVARGERVVIVTGDRVNGMSKGEAKYERIFGAEVYRYKVIGFFLYYITCTILLLKLKKSYRFSTIISRSVPTTICCILAGFKEVKYIAPGVYKYQNHPQFQNRINLKSRFRYKVNVLLEAFCLKYLRSVYVFSDNMQKQVYSLNSKLEVIKVTPGIDKTIFFEKQLHEVQALRDLYGIPNDKIVLLFMGRIESIKNPTDAIKLVSQLDDRYVLLIVGNGSLKSSIRNLVNNGDLLRKVHFFDFTKHPEHFYKLSDGFLMLSMYESFGQVILESFACGTAVFGYRSSEKVNTATSEIFESLKIDSRDFLCDYSCGVGGIKDRVISYFEWGNDGCGDLVNLNVRSWYDFVTELRQS